MICLVLQNVVSLRAHQLTDVLCITRIAIYHLSQTKIARPPIAIIGTRAAQLMNASVGFGSARYLLAYFNLVETSNSSLAHVARLDHAGQLAVRDRNRRYRRLMPVMAGRQLIDHVDGKT